PLVDQQLIVDPEAYAVVRLRIEGVAARGGRFDLPGPADTEPVLMNGCIRRAEAPVEVDGRVGAVELELGKSMLVEVLAFEAGAREQPAGFERFTRGGDSAAQRVTAHSSAVHWRADHNIAFPHQSPRPGVPTLRRCIEA